MLVRRFSGMDALSEMFEYELELITETAQVKRDDLVGQKVTVEVETAKGAYRYFHGFVNSFAQVQDDTSFSAYRISVVPWCWFLTRNSNSRIWEEKTVPDIIKEVFAGLGFSDYDFRTTATYPVLTYCVQYRESDFDFVSRLMEHEGIYYYFLHEDGKHTMVLTDSASSHDPVPG
ncbi:MAG: type VI secretion system tip protein TssI/VgrG, partial [Verrucomicrobiota bacterium]